MQAFACIRKAASFDPSSRLAIIDMGWKVGSCAAFRGELGPHQTQCHLGQGLPSYQVASWFKMPLGSWYKGSPRPRPHCVKGHSPPIFSPCLLWSNDWIDQNATWYRGRPWPKRHYVNGDPALPLKGAQPPIFGSCLLWSNGWIDKDATWYEGKPRPKRHCVRWGPSSPLKGAQLPLFGRCLLWPNGWMDQDATWYGGRPRPRPHCVRWGASFGSLSKKWAQPPNFRPMSPHHTTTFLWPFFWDHPGEPVPEENF